MVQNCNNIAGVKNNFMLSFWLMISHYIYISSRYPDGIQIPTKKPEIHNIYTYKILRKAENIATPNMGGWYSFIRFISSLVHKNYIYVSGYYRLDVKVLQRKAHHKCFCVFFYSSFSRPSMTFMGSSVQFTRSYSAQR